jgi:glycosyltransferase involved in cell wall biosynthesis
MKPRRVAFFTDSFHEVNGVALTSREFVNFARRRSIPMLSVHAGPTTRTVHEGSVSTFEFNRGPVRWTLETDLAIDLLFLRHRRRLMSELEAFQPDLIHITGPGDAGILGALAAYELKIPLAASWHTNLHEFAGRRLARFMSALPEAVRSGTAEWAERFALDRCVWFYGLAKLLFAPNPDLVELLGRRTGKPAFLMTRGIDTELFSPARRVRHDDAFVVGYVGRLSPEKNVRTLRDLDQSLASAGVRNYRFLIVGDGSERPWLREVLPHAELPGILRGKELASAYASMDAFVFPSSTDTFGNVVLEAMASGVPVVVASGGGPKFLVQNGTTGYVADNHEEFVRAILELNGDPSRRSQMAKHARDSVQRLSWDSVFEQVYSRYDSHLASQSSESEVLRTPKREYWCRLLFPS